MARQPSRNKVRPAPPASGGYQLLCYRVAPGQPQQLRLLAPRLLGLVVHWYQGSSKPCHGENCPSARHTAPWTWRGYSAAYLWDQAAALWFPWVLEITENCEQDMRGVYTPGQVWELSRAEKHGPITARLLEPPPDNGAPAPFDVLNVLVRMYHDEAISLDRPNPLPARAQAQAFAAPPPVDPAAPPSAEPATAADFKRLSRLPWLAAAQPNGVHRED